MVQQDNALLQELIKREREIVTEELFGVVGTYMVSLGEKGISNAVQTIGHKKEVLGRDGK